MGFEHFTVCHREGTPTGALYVIGIATSHTSERLFITRRIEGAEWDGLPESGEDRRVAILNKLKGSVESNHSAWETAIQSNQQTPVEAMNELITAELGGVTFDSVHRE